jgi:hypothetical protein
MSALLESAVFAPVDTQLAKVLGRRCGEASPEALAAVALASLAVRQGHVALRLDQAQSVLDRAWFDADLPAADKPDVPSLEVVGRSALVHGTASPLMLEDGQLYLRRY